MSDGVFSANGRITRASYWAWSVAASVLSVVAGFAAEASPSLILSLLALVGLLLLSVMVVLQGVKRMHDVDKSGWYLLAPIYGIALAYLVDGTVGPNRFGDDPKGRRAQSQSAPAEDVVAHDAPIDRTAPQLIKAIADRLDAVAIAALLETGIDVEKRAADGSTALLIAAGSSRDPRVIKALLDAGADVAVRNNDGETALMIAAASNPVPEVIAILLSAGADIEAKDGSGGTPLMFAAEFNENPEVVISLLTAGADAKARDDGAKTSLEYAQTNRRLYRTEAYEMLSRASK